MSGHPDWLAVGRAVRTVRMSVGGAVVHEAVLVVERQTRTGVSATYPGGGRQRYRIVRGEYVLTPRYLDYHEVLRPLDPEASR